MLWAYWSSWLNYKTSNAFSIKFSYDWKWALERMKEEIFLCKRSSRFDWLIVVRLQFSVSHRTLVLNRMKFIINSVNQIELWSLFHRSINNGFLLDNATHTFDSEIYNSNGCYSDWFIDVSIWKLMICFIGSREKNLFFSTKNILMPLVHFLLVFGKTFSPIHTQLLNEEYYIGKMFFPFCS